MTANRRQRSVLVFEDKDAEWELLRPAIRDAGFRPVRADSVDAFKAHTPFDQFALILIDLYVGDGVEGIRVGTDLTEFAVRTRGRAAIPVIVMSRWNVSRHDVAESFRAGAADYVDKSSLIADVGGHLGRALDAVGPTAAASEEDELPLPVAFLLRHIRRSQMAPQRRFERIVELAEVTVKLCAILLLAGARRDLARLLGPETRRGLLRPSFGHFVRTVIELSTSQGDDPIARVASRPRFRETAQAFVQLRNDFIGHGSVQAEAVYERMVAEHGPALQELVRDLSVLRDRELVAIKHTELTTAGYQYTVHSFRGSNPEPLVRTIETAIELRPTEHVFCLDQARDVALDLHPWAQYVVCEQRCFSRKLFLYRMCRGGEIWSIDHVYGHQLQSARGGTDVEALVGATA